METTIRLEAQEAVLLADRIQNVDTYFEDDEPIAKALLLKIFSVVNQLTTDTSLEKGEMEMAVTKKELWLMASKISMFDKTDGKPVGLKLRRKIHSILILAESEVEGLPYGDAKEAEYQERREEQDAESNPGSPKDGSADKTFKTPYSGKNLPGPKGTDPQKD